MIAWLKRLFHFHNWEELERGKAIFGYIKGREIEKNYFDYRCTICKTHKTEYT